MPVSMVVADATVAFEPDEWATALTVTHSEATAVPVTSSDADPYGEPDAGVYTAAKHQVPADVGVKAADVAVAVAPAPAAKATGPEPTVFVAVGVQGWAAEVGPQSEKVTVPAGAPPPVVPVTVAASVTAVPVVTEVALTAVVTTGVTGVGVTAGSATCRSLPPHVESRNQ